MGLFESADVLLTDFLAGAAIQSGEFDFSIIEPRNVNVLSVDSGCTRRSAIEIVDVVRRCRKLFLPNRRASSLVEGQDELRTGFWIGRCKKNVVIPRDRRAVTDAAKGLLPKSVCRLPG